MHAKNVDETSCTDEKPAPTPNAERKSMIPFLLLLLSLFEQSVDAQTDYRHTFIGTRARTDRLLQYTVAVSGTRRPGYTGASIYTNIHTYTYTYYIHAYGLHAYIYVY